MIEMYSTESRPLRHDYQFMREVILGGYEWPENHPRPSAHLLQAVVHNYFTSGRAADGKGRAKGQQRKKFRRRDDDMPLVVRSGECLRVGDFTPKYEKPGQHRSYNCQIAFEGMKFLGKLPGRTPAGRILQGVAITHLADGWYASIKQIVPKRALPEAVPGSLIGMNMGLDKMVALSDGRVVENPRGHALAREISRLQSIEKPTGRLHQKMARIARHKLYNELVKPLATVETIKIEKLDANVGFLPHDWDGKSSNQKSCMRLAGRILKERYGDRVREVECFNVSVTCSQCGKISVDAWAYRADPVCKCPHCGLVLDRDINAARNVASKPLELQDAAE
jgi:transposase